MIIEVQKKICPYCGKEVVIFQTGVDGFGKPYVKKNYYCDNCGKKIVNKEKK